MSPAGPNIYRPTIDTRSSTQSFVLTTTSTVFYAVLGSVHTNDLNDSPGPDIYRPTSSTSTSYQPFGPTATSIIPPDVLESVDTNIPKGSWKVKVGASLGTFLVIWCLVGLVELFRVNCFGIWNRVTRSQKLNENTALAEFRKIMIRYLSFCTLFIIAWLFGKLYFQACKRLEE